LEEENLVKKTCKELGITQKELAERIGVAPV
jgi:predicted transcriptional regulator